MMQDTHTFQGMRRDNHPIRQEKQFLWDAHNIRLTNRDGDTLLSLSNEKSTRFIKEFANQDYVGHCVLGNYLILFTTCAKDYGKEDYSTIYRIEATKGYPMVILYKGQLGFSVDHPLQTLGVAESDLVQKVWWTDGINPVRMINIKKPELLNAELGNDKTYSYIYSDAPFNLIRELDLNEKVKIGRSLGSGIFPAGVIQYCFTYYDRFGSESNIFYTSDLFYIAHPDRGGSPEDSIPVVFNIEIDRPQRTFDFIRIYSIVRTSINATPTAKRVADVPIPSTGSVTYTDNNTTGDIITPTQLLYVGGSNIIAGCLASKDNTLFLGDITLSNLGAIPKKLRGSIKNNTDIGTIIYSIPLPSFDNDTTNGYEYHTQLENNFCTYKYGETYRLGLQFQYKDGSWSDPIFCKDMVAQSPDGLTRPVYMGGAIMGNTKFTCTLNSEDIEKLRSLGYKKVRPVVVLPSINDRTIIAQGMLCPTVFNAYNRLENSPFSQSSWFFRPHSFNLKSESLKEGSYVESTHYKPLLTGFNNGAEVQNMFLAFNSKSREDENIGDKFNLKNVGEQLTLYNNFGYSTLYYVDQSILTFHSPDIEFDDDIAGIIASEPNLHIRLIGAAEFNTSYGSINIQTSTPPASGKSVGAINSSTFNNVDGGKSLVSGLYYQDVEVWSKDNKIVPWTDAQFWKVYPWQRSGSLNNDINRSDGSTRTSTLKKKVISNLKISNRHYWLRNPYNLNSDKLDIFNSNEIELIKFKDEAVKNGNITYFGNVDSFSTSYQPFRLVTTDPVYQGTGDTVFIGTLSDGDKIEVPINKSFEEQKSFTVTVLDITDKIIGVSNLRIEIVGEGAHIKIYDSSARVVRDEIIPTGNYKILNQYTDTNVIYNSSLKEHALDPPTESLKTNEALYSSKDPVRIKYKSTPHAIVTLKYDTSGHRTMLPYINTGSGNVVVGNDEYWLKDNQDKPFLISKAIEENAFLDSYGNEPISSSYLWMAEIYRDDSSIANRFGGDSEEALQNNLWLPAGEPVRLNDQIIWEHGDTWLQRYDCLKTYPFTKEDENQIVEIGSFACETHVNIDGRYDRNRGNIDNSNVSPENFNLINPVYSQLNNFFTYRILDDLYYRTNKYPNQIIWSLSSIPNSDVDVWTQIKPSSYLNLDSRSGRITSINNFNEHLIALQENSINEVLFNSRVQISTSDNVPIEITNSGRVDGYRVISDSIGCQDNFSVIASSRGIYFLDNYRNTCYLFNGSIEDLGLKLGTNYWFRDSSANIRLCYDSKYQDIYFSPKQERESLCYSELLGQFTSFMDYGSSVIFNLKDKCLSLADSPEGTLCLWENFPEDSDSYNEIFGVVRPYSFSFISNDNPLITKIFDTIEMRADSYNEGKLLGDKYSTIYESGQPFNYIEVSNEYQDTGPIDFNSSTLRKKFRVWRGIIPRNRNTRERIRNPWAKITLGMKNPSTKMTVLHDISVGYTI